MRNTLTATLLALTFAAAQAHAADPNQYASVPGGVCKVSSTSASGSNQFDARAIGARNFGTTGGVFVICPFVLTPTPIEGGVVTELNLSAFTLDGATRPMTCTAVIGSLTRYIDATYSAKTVAVDGSMSTTLTWTASDFNGASPTGGIVGSAWATVTCLVPPQTAIALMYAKQNPTIR